MKRLKKIKNWYETYERRISISSLLLGFFVDYFTLQRIDALRENLWITGNLLLVGLCIILLNRDSLNDKKAKGSFTSFWLPNILQFSFGALLGSVFIFYFRSAAISVAWPFMLILFVAMVANELFQKRYAKLAFQLSLFYFAIFSLSIFLVPLLIKQIGVGPFVLSGFASLVVVWMYLVALRYFARERFIESKTGIWTLIFMIFIGINVLYFTNLIPPIPLSLKDSGIYHSIEKSVRNDYIVTEEVMGMERYFILRPKIHWLAGETLHVYTAIYSPGSLNTDVVHDWQYRNAEGEWISTTRIPLYLTGGRLGGFRTFTSKNNFAPGFWRVDVMTPRGQLIGRINFEIVLTNVAPPLKTLIKN